MTRFDRRRWALTVAGVILTPVLCLAAPDSRSLFARWEDDLLDGEIDAEDLLAQRFAPPLGAFGRQTPAYIGLEAYKVDRPVGSSEFGALLVLELPLERFMRLAAPPLSSAAFESLSYAGAAPSFVPMGLADVTPVRSDAQGRGEPVVRGESAVRDARAAPAAPLAVTTDVARACIRAALRMVGLSDDSRLDSVAARARSSAALPELRLRAVRTLGESGRVSLSEDDPTRYVASGAATNVLEARLTFRLDRLLFADEELAVERVRIDRSELRSRTTSKALQGLFEWQRAYALATAPGLSPDDHWTAVLKELEACAILDAVTGGWFGGYRASLPSPAP